MAGEETQDHPYQRASMPAGDVSHHPQPRHSTVQRRRGKERTPKPTSDDPRPGSKSRKRRLSGFRNPLPPKPQPARPAFDVGPLA